MIYEKQRRSEAPAHMSLNNLQAILAENGMTLNDVVKTTVFVKDLDDFATVNQIYESYSQKRRYLQTGEQTFYPSCKGHGDLSSSKNHSTLHQLCKKKKS